jgi:hypothetical protein
MTTENFPFEGKFSDEPIKPETDTVEQQEKLKETLAYVAEQEDQDFVKALEQLEQEGLKAIDVSPDKSSEVIQQVETKVNKKSRLTRGAFFLIKLGTMAAPLLAIAGNNIGCSGQQVNGLFREGGRMINDTGKFAGRVAGATLEEVGASIEDSKNQARYDQYETTSYEFNRNASFQYEVDSSGRSRSSIHHSADVYNNDESSHSRNRSSVRSKNARANQQPSSRDVFEIKHKNDNYPMQ